MYLCDFVLPPFSRRTEIYTLEVALADIPEDGAGVVAGGGERSLVAAERAEERLELVAGGAQQGGAVARQRPRVAARAVEELLVRVEQAEVVAAQDARQIYSTPAHTRATRLPACLRTTTQ